MGSFTFSEILTILVVILVVFGPKRLPDLARRAGELVAKTRDATRSVTQALEREYGDEAQPFRDLKQQIDGVKDDVRNATASVTDIAAAEEVAPDAADDEGSNPESSSNGREAGGSADPTA
jgi:sec-independent protein translocase protein TatB